MRVLVCVRPCVFASEWICASAYFNASPNKVWTRYNTSQLACNAALRRACVSVPARTPAGGQQGVSRPRPVEKAKPGRPNLAGLAQRWGGYLVRTAPPARTGMARREWASDLPGYGQA
jgi:hypothetical protein